MRVLVTGASGRLAPYVIRDLLAAGHEVALFARRRPVEEFAALPLTIGDINCFEDCQRALAGGADAIAHLAAQPWPVDHPELGQRARELDIPFDATMRSNIMGLYYLLHAAVEAKVGTVVMTGSNCALGHGFRVSGRPFPIHYLPIDEQHPCEPEDSYSYSKLAGEDLLAMYTRSHGLRTYALRSAGICNVERRRDMAKHVGPVGGWSDWMWCWVGSEDVASAHRLLIERAPDIEPHGVYFCNGDDTQVLEPSLDLVERFRPDLVPLVRELPGHASLHSNAALKRACGWAPRTSWREHLD